MSETEIKTGIFKEEIKNRFLCLVNVDGSDTVCYIPSSCRLSNFIDLTNREVMLSPIKKANARTKYSVWAVKYRGSFVPLNLSSANETIYCSLQRRLFSFLGDRHTFQREKVIDGYKSDIYIEDSDTVIEIKSILSFKPTASFPTVYSERAIRQLENIRDLLEHGHNVCYMFLSMYSGVKEIYLDQQQKEYSQLFCECIEKGMTVCGFSLGMKDGESSVKTRITVHY